MRITMLGTGTSFPDPERVQSGILVETEQTAVLLDAGSGTLHRLTQVGLDFGKLDAVILTHFHVDHCSDLPTLCQTLWLEGFDKALNVYGPPSIRQWAEGLFTDAYPYLHDKIDIRFNELESRRIVLGNLQLENTPTCHGTMETRALRLEDGSISLVYSSDTSPCDGVIRLAEDVDLLIHECNWLDGEHPKDVHSSPSEVAEVVEAASPFKTLLTHVSPEVVAKEKQVVGIVARNVGTSVEMARDLMTLDL
jgi:ribonuclease BN (tRNA processing enzyme)